MALPVAWRPLRRENSRSFCSISSESCCTIRVWVFTSSLGVPVSDGAHHLAGYGDPEEEDAPYRPLKLPEHLRKEHGRRLSKVDANVRDR